MELSNKQNTAQPLPPLMMMTTTTVSDDGNVSGDNILSEVEEEVPPLPFPYPRQTIFKNFRFHNMDGKCQSNSLPNFAQSEKRQRKTREKNEHMKIMTICHSILQTLPPNRAQLPFWRKREMSVCSVVSQSVIRVLWWHNSNPPPPKKRNDRNRNQRDKPSNKGSTNSFARICQYQGKIIANISTFGWSSMECLSSVARAPSHQL